MAANITILGEVEKGGQTYIDFMFYRGKKGLEVTVKAVAEVEDFFRSLGTGEVENVEIHGRHWYAPDPEKPLKVYNMLQQLNSPHYYVAAVGEALKPPTPINRPYQQNQPQQGVNLSFLRLQGISGVDGVSFGWTMPISPAEANQFSEQITSAADKFVRDHIVPFYIQTAIVTTSLP